MAKNRSQALMADRELALTSADAREFLAQLENLSIVLGQVIRAIDRATLQLEHRRLQLRTLIEVGGVR